MEFPFNNEINKTSMPSINIIRGGPYTSTLQEMFECATDTWGIKLYPKSVSLQRVAGRLKSGVLILLLEAIVGRYFSSHVPITNTLTHTTYRDHASVTRKVTKWIVSELFLWLKFTWGKIKLTKKIQYSWIALMNSNLR